MASISRTRWQIERSQPHRVVVVDAGADVAEWDDEVEIVRRWHKTLGLESVALLGWDRVIDASDFLDAPGSYHQSHQARGPVLGIPLLALRESLHPGPARAVVLSATEVLDKPDWDDREWLGWDGLELRFFGVGPNSKEPLVQANQGRVDRFVAGSDRPVADPLVSVAGPSAVSIVRSGPSPQADSPPILQPAPSTLQVAAASGRQPVVFEVVGYDAEETAPSVVRSDGWVLGRLAGPADGGDWQGPTDVGTASLDVLRAFFAGEQYACPREGCGREHAGTLRCPTRGEWALLDRPPWSVSEVEQLLVAASRWVVLVTSGGEAEEELTHARLWTTGTHALFGDDGALYWAADGGRPRRFEYHAARGWAQRTDDDSKRNGEVIPLDLCSGPPLGPATEPNGLHRHAYLLLV